MCKTTTLHPSLNPGLSCFWIINKFVRISRNESCPFQSGMDAVSSNQIRLSPERLLIIHVSNVVCWTPLDNQQLKGNMRLNMSSLFRFGRGPGKTAESDIVLSELHTDARLILVTSSWRNQVSLNMNNYFTAITFILSQEF